MRILGAKALAGLLAFAGSLVLTGFLALSGPEPVAEPKGQPALLLRSRYEELVSFRVDRAPVIDGKTEPLWEKAQPLRVWTFPIQKFGNRRLIPVDLRSVHTDTEIFFLVRWPDDTQSLHFKPWVFDGEEWKELKELADDAFAFNWNISSPLFPVIGCRAQCHLSAYPERSGLSPHDMWTNQPGVKLDHWEWRATETGALGWVKDGRIDYVDFEAFIKKNPGQKPRGRYLDGGEHNPDIFQFNMDPATEDRPQFVPNPAKGGDLHAAGIRITGPDSVVSLEKIDKDRFRPGDYVAGILLPAEVPKHLRGDLQGKAVYADGHWTLELGRRLITGDPDDIQFDSRRDGPYLLGIAVFDHSVYHNFSDVIRLRFR